MKLRHIAQIYRRLFKYVKPYIGQLVISSLAMIGVAGSTAAIALLMKNVLDDVFITQDRRMLVIVPAAIIIIYLMKGIFRYVRTYVMNAAGIRIIRDIRNDLYRHLHRLSMAYFTETPTGILMSRVTYDVSMIQSAITDALTGAVRDVFTLVALAGVVLYRNPTLGAIGLIGFPFAIYPMFRFGSIMKEASRRSQEQMGDLNKLMQERISGMGLVKASGAEEFELERFEEENEGLVVTFLKVQKVRALSQPVMEFVGAASAALIIWMGGTMVMNGSMTVGEFFSFLTALILMYEPVKHMNSVNNVMQQGLAAAERVFELFDITPDIQDTPGAIDLGRVEGLIEFDHVSFRYGEEWILKDINLRIEPGTKLAIVGTSGGGKTTMVNLIPRFFDVKEGKISVDGHDVRDVTQKSLRNQISIVSQEVVLFNESVRNNICYGMDGLTENDINRALVAAYASDFVQSMPEGLETIIGERGTMLSGGQRQRLSITRAILKDSPVLILDEATSSLDTESEHLVSRALDNLVVGRTTLIIAHRISTVRNADRILVVTDGKITESGKHAELIERGGEYARLYSLLVEDVG